MRFAGLCALFFGLWTSGPAGASIVGFTSVEIDLTDAGDAKEKATWGPESFNVTNQGLGWEGEHRSSRDFQLTTQPIGIGTSWRPTTSAGVRVTLSPETRGYKLANGQQAYENVGQVFVRYSPDRKHWSSWQAVGFSAEAHQESQENAAVKAGYTPFLRSYSTSIAVPRTARERYSDHLSEYMQSDVVWNCDEEALCRQLVADDPDYFQTEQPFVGYVQVMYEGSLSGGMRLEKMKVDISWVVGGLHSIPKDPKVAEDRDGVWQFVAE